MPSEKDLKVIVCIARMCSCTLIAFILIGLIAVVIAATCVLRLDPLVLIVCAPLLMILFAVLYFAYTGRAAMMDVALAVGEARATFKTDAGADEPAPKGKGGAGGKPF